jgi:hypothetical protein
MTVARLEAEMPNAEFVAWCAHFGLEAQRAELAAGKAGRRGA